MIRKSIFGQFTNSSFQRIQVPGSTDIGRYLVTKKEDDKYRFRVQSLRNVAFAYPVLP